MQFEQHIKVSLRLVLFKIIASAGKSLFKTKLEATEIQDVQNGPYKINFRRGKQRGEFLKPHTHCCTITLSFWTSWKLKEALQYVSMNMDFIHI